MSALGYMAKRFPQGQGTVINIPGETKWQDRKCGGVQMFIGYLYLLLIYLNVYWRGNGSNSSVVNIMG